MEEFVNLHNRTVSRSEVERVISIAKEQNNTEVIYRLSRILNAYPTEQRFVINIKDYPTPPTALAGAHHTGDYREALDDCGRLKKGWKFSKGQVVKVVPKAKKTPNTPTATTAVESKQLVSYTAEKFANDLDINKLERSLHWLSFDPKGRAQREQESFGNSIAELYTSNLEQAKQTGALEAYNDAFDKGYSYILKNYLEMVGIRARTFSTAITGGAGITERKIASNEKLMRSEHERLQKHIDLQEKLQERLAKIAKNKPADQYEEGDVIKSTDNNATTKLQQKLKMLQDRKTMLKNGVVAAKEYQKSKDISVFKQYNIDSETTEQIINHIDKGGKPTEKDMYSWFTMPYLNRDIKEVENRIATLEKNQAKGTDETLIEGGKIVYNGEAQRLQIFFDGIPSKEVRESLKSHAFKWAPTAKAWQRTLTENAKYAVNQYLIKTGILKLRTALSMPYKDDELTFLAAAGIDYFEEAPDDKAQGLGKPIPAADIYKMITDKVISMFKNAKASDYHRAWKDDAFFIPLNFDSKKPYRGVNRLLLQERIGLTEAFPNPYFLTFKQIKKHKGTLKKGAKGYEVVYYSIRYVVPADKNTGRKAYSSTNNQKVLDYLAKNKLTEDIVTRIPMIRYYNVYNGEDITGIDFKLPEVKIGRVIPDTATENQAAELIVKNYPNPPAIKHGGNEAYYEINQDLVRIPKVEQFDSINDYYRTLFHELTHSTRHENRLNREKNSFRFGDTGYAKEELVAEFGAVFLSAWAGIMWYNNKNHAAYLKGWNSAIKEAENDNKFLMKAASLAQAATDYILNLNAAGQPAFLSKYEKLDKKAKKNKPEAQKATEKADDTDKKYKFIAFYNSYGRINGIYSYQNLTINEFYLKNTFDDGIKVYAPLRSLEKIEEAKRIIEEQYIEGKDFICLKFESKKREEYYSLLIHSNEKPKPESSLYEAFSELLSQIKSTNADIPSNELEDFLYNFGSQHYIEKEKIYTFFYDKVTKPIGSLSAYKKHPLFTKVKNPQPHHAGYTTTKRGTEILNIFIKDFEALKQQYDYNHYSFTKFWNIATEKPKPEAPASKIQIIPPYPIDIESNEENDDYMQLEKELSDLMGDKFEVWANNLIEQKRKDRLAERSKEIKANIDTLKNKEKGATAYEYVRNEYGYNYKVNKKDTKKYEVTLTIYRYGSFNPNENYYDTFKTPEECSAFIIKTLDEQDGFYYSNWYGLSELQNKINELKGYQYCKQFNYQEEEKKAENPKPEAPKAPEKFPAAGTTKVFFTSQVDEIVDYVKKNGDNRGYINIDFTNKQTLKLLSQYGWGTYGFINTYDYPESAPKSKTKGVMSLKKIVSTDKLRIQITGVYIDSDYYIATNAISLIWVPRPKNDEYKTGWIFDANFKCKKLGGCKIEDYLINSDRFPIDRIREMQKAPIAYTSQQIDLTTLLDHLYRGYKAIRAINSTQEAIVITLQADKKIQYIDLKILIDLLDALRTNGAQTITFGFENLSGNSPIHISTDTQLQGLVMPRIFDENKVPTVKNCLMIAPLPLTLTEISKPTKGLSAPTDGTLFGKYPEISTDTFKDMKVSELRAFTLSYYLTHLKGKKVAIKNHLKEVIFTTKAGRKIAKGEAMYKEKAAVVERLEELIKNSTYNNWGSRKTQDNPNILGYLNFKSKLTIDGEKRHVRIAISLTRERKTELKNVEVGKKKSASFRKATVVNPQDGRNETLSANIPAKTVPNTLANQQIDRLANPIIEKSTTPPRKSRANPFCGDSAPTNIPSKTMPNTLANRQIDKLANPIMPPTVYVEHLPEETNQQISTSANTLDAKMAALQTRNWETFVIANPQLQRFLGDVERKTSESTVITIAGGAGSGKTRFAFQFINALAQNYKVGHASLEEHPDSKLYYDKVQQYIDETALPNIDVPEIKDLDQLEALIHRNEVIVIDSFAKLQELNPRFLLDRDLRKKYDGKLFLLIYQLTGEGKMRGGSKSEYDGDIILLTHVAPDYRENYIYPSKNRYNALPATQLRYSTYFQQMLDIPQELGTGSRPPEAISLPPATQTNVYEVIY